MQVNCRHCTLGSGNNSQLRIRCNISGSINAWNTSLVRFIHPDKPAFIV
jgi:hypothetical protein